VVVGLRPKTEDNIQSLDYLKAMDFQDKITKLTAIGTPPTIGEDRFAQAMLYALVQSKPSNLPTALNEWMPVAILKAHASTVGLMKEYLCYKDASGKLEFSDVRYDQEAAYWDGNTFTFVPWLGAAQTWVNDYAALAAKIVDLAKCIAPLPVTIIDFGGGFGTLSFHVALKAREIGLALPKFINIDREPYALAFSVEFSRRHDIEMRHLWMDATETLARPERADTLVSMLSEDESVKILITRSALHPNFTTAQYSMLFDFFIKRVGAEAGVHWENLGFRTDTYREIVTAFKTLPPITKFWTDWPSDPFEFLTSNADPLGIKVTERIDIWQNFPALRMPLSAFWPSYLAWRRVQ
jgi:hypothetical protein